MHLHAVLLAIDLDLGLWVQCADGLGNGFFAVSTAHAFDVEDVFHEWLLKR
jgi:hypothetical protein